MFSQLSRLFRVLLPDSEVLMLAFSTLPGALDRAVVPQLAIYVSGRWKKRDFLSPAVSLEGRAGGLAAGPVPGH